MKVFFIGAGPGDPELLTVKAEKIIGLADIIIYAGSLVNRDILKITRSEAKIYDSASMNLDEVTALYDDARKSEGIIARVHTGDPSLYGAIQEQIDWCEVEGIPCEVIPGVSSFSAAAASLKQELTLPGVSMSVIITRLAGRTAVPKKEDLMKLARSEATMVIFLSVQNIEKLVTVLTSACGSDTPAAVVYRASWSDEKIIRGTLENIAQKTIKAGIKRQAIIIVGRILDRNYEKSRLYDPCFSHQFRRSKE